jgi:Asp-tRNA(Asn)/Glu-tRNA(Gln) amidotransferase A subunit family amidase
MPWVTVYGRTGIADDLPKADAIYVNAGTTQPRINGEQNPYRNLMIWPSIATAPGLPSTAVPVAMSKSGLPIGVQITGPYLEDRTVLKLAELIEHELGGFHAPVII